MIGAPVIRRAAEPDGEKIAELLGELGYSVHPSWARERLAAFNARPDEAVFVAEHNEEVVGFASIHVFPLFHAEVWAGRVTALVVDARQRRKGVGRQLLSAVEAYAWQRRCGQVEVTSTGTHEPAPAFYEQNGYRRSESYLIKPRP